MSGLGSSRYPLIVSLSATRVALLKFHTLLLSRIQLDPSSPSFHTRLLKSSIGFVTMVMESKTPVLNPNAEVGENAGGKKGKKRARGVGEEVVVAGMEGRVGRGLSRLEGEVVLAALKRRSSIGMGCLGYMVS
jgi:hypothetical protein